MMKESIRIVLFVSCLSFMACQKDILDKKPDKSLLVPETLTDLQALLDNNVTVFGTDYRGIAELGSADFYLDEAGYNGLTNVAERNAYTWQQDIFESQSSISEWDRSYTQVFQANVVLEQMEHIVQNNQNQNAWNNVRGTALFFRAYAFLNLTQIFVPAYREETASEDLGIPIRLSADINQASFRATVGENYVQIIKDLQIASSILPVKQEYKTRPDRAAACALLARTFLYMNRFEEALQYVDSALGNHATVMDYNAIDPKPTFPFPIMNGEVIFHRFTTNYRSFSIGNLKMDTLLMDSYAEGDLRKQLFFVENRDGSYSFRGGYGEATAPFGGLAVNELLLTKAECHARLSQVSEALETINGLLSKRYKDGMYIPFQTADPVTALDFILSERRKELVMRALRWSDLRRLNKEERYAVGLSRKLGDKLFQLPPNDPRYTYPIPNYVIAITGMEQNQR